LNSNTAVFLSGFPDGGFVTAKPPGVWPGVNELSILDKTNVVFFSYSIRPEHCAHGRAAPRIAPHAGKLGSG
jgi:hypothetical protein